MDPQNKIPHVNSSHASFPIIAIAIIGILATGFLLVSYYVFVIKCCLNWHRVDILRRFSFSRNRGQGDLLTVQNPQPAEKRGLDEYLIRSIPIFQFQKEFGEKNSNECAVCLSEFKEEEKLRVIPNCSHVFHIDCIDVWLQNNTNCPLCRSSISMATQFPFILDQVISPNPDNFSGRDEDYVVIELGEQERSVQSVNSPSEVKKLEWREKKLSHVSSMGDECIDTIRGKDKRFLIQPMRRSFSMDSAADQQLYLAVQEIVQQKRNVSEISSSEGCSNRVRRPFFSFGSGRGSRSAVLPIQFES